MQHGVLFGVLALVGGWALVAYIVLPTSPYAEARSIGTNVRDFAELSERFRSLADERGAVYAFEVLRRAALPPDTDLHLLGHVVGDELYLQQGPGGIAVCTQDFRNACSHTIVIGTLNEFGASDATVEMIRDACTEAPGGSGAYTMCFHGLGHGVFAYFEYDIPHAVDFCRQLGTAEYGTQEYTQCVGGMIMELMGGGGHDPEEWERANARYLDPHDPLAPCDGPLIPDDAKNFCYIYLTPHLFDVAGADRARPDPLVFPKAFSLCDDIGDVSLRRVCWGSFGKEFVPLAGLRDIRQVDQFSDDEFGLAISWCMLAPQEKAKEACIEQALSSVFWGGENDPNASFRFCALVDEGPMRDSCYRELARNIASYIQGEQRKGLCARVPESMQEQCVTAYVAPGDRP
jgi:hypothetical protein